MDIHTTYNNVYSNHVCEMYIHLILHISYIDIKYIKAPEHLVSHLELMTSEARKSTEKFLATYVKIIMFRNEIAVVIDKADL